MAIEHRILADVRVQCEAKSVGTLSLTNEAGERLEVHIRDGLLDSVMVGDSLTGSFLSARRLGHYLVENAGVSVKDLVAVQSEARRHKVVFGEAAIRKGLVDAVGVRTLVRQQAIDLLSHALEKDFSPDGFSANTRSFRVPASLSVDHLLLEISRRKSLACEFHADDWIVLSEGKDLSSFPWLPQEISVLTHLASPATIQQLQAQTHLDRDIVERILAVLADLALVESGELSEGGVVAGASAGGTANSVYPVERLIPATSDPILDEKLDAVVNASSYTREQFRSLKVRMSEVARDGRGVFAVSSPDIGDGKSLVSAGLAFSFAMDPGRRVVLVDFDLRRPAVGRYLGVPTEPGLLQYLRNGHAGPRCYVRRVENLYYMTTGGVAPDAIEILSSSSVKNLIKTLREEFDTIILDAPPYSPIADARLVTAHSDGLLLVIRRGRTSFSRTERTFKAIDQNKLLGVVFNDVRPMLFNTLEGYGYYGYDHGQYIYSASKDVDSPRRTRSYLD